MRNYLLILEFIHFPSNLSNCLASQLDYLKFSSPYYCQGEVSRRLGASGHFLRVWDALSGNGVSHHHYNSWLCVSFVDKFIGIKNEMGIRIFIIIIIFLPGDGVSHWVSQLSTPLHPCGQRHRWVSYTVSTVLFFQVQSIFQAPVWDTRTWNRLCWTSASSRPRFWTSAGTRRSRLTSRGQAKLPSWPISAQSWNSDCWTKLIL